MTAQPFFNGYLKGGIREAVIMPVCKKMEEGFRPKLLEESVIPRPELSCQIESELKLSQEKYFCNFGSDSDQVIRKAEFRHFGVIVGPMGTGKSSLVRTICQKYSREVLYYEIVHLDLFAVGP